MLRCVRKSANIVGMSGLVTSALRHQATASNKTMSAEQAAGLVRSGDTICVSGFVAQSPPELMCRTLSKRFEETGEPSNLTLAFHGGPGDWAERGLNHFAKKGMLAKTISAHYGQTPRIADLIRANEIEAYSVPMGTLSRMIRAGASGRTAHNTTVGLGTMADPDLGGGRLNERTTAHLPEKLVNSNGLTVLRYPALSVNVAIIRGTTADPDGNITMERESLYLDCLNEAMAARSNGGIVICQVERIAARHSLNPRLVRIPGALVDVVVVAEDVQRDHPMSFFTSYNPAFSGELRVPLDQTKPMPLNARKIIARRAALNLLPGNIVNLGIGMPEGVAAVAAEEGVLDSISLTTEPGTHGGVGASGHDFGPAVNYSALLEMHQQFDFYNGGGLDVCFLGMAEVTAAGDVNVTRLGNVITGPGGFIDISQCTQRVNLMGTMTAGGLETEVVDGKLRIIKEGRIRKFINRIPEVTFSAAQALENGQVVKYITERCVFSLTRKGISLTEVAPGIDIQRDILDQMDFKPVMESEPREMNPVIFQPEKMDLAGSLGKIEMKNRLFYSDATDTLFCDLSSVYIRTSEDVKNVMDATQAFFDNRCGAKADVEINRFGLKIDHEVLEEFNEAVAVLEARYYRSVRRHTGRTFTHLKSAQPRETPPEQLSVEDALSYIQRHGLSISKESARDLFFYTAKGNRCIGREEFAGMLERLKTSRRPTSD